MSTLIGVIKHRPHKFSLKTNLLLQDVYKNVSDPEGNEGNENLLSTLTSAVYCKQRQGNEHNLNKHMSMYTKQGLKKAVINCFFARPAAYILKTTSFFAQRKIIH